MGKAGYLQCNGEDWQKARMRTLVRDDFTCQFARLGLAPIEGGCSYEKPEARLRFLHVHHVQHRVNGGTHDLDNLITMCRAHHVMLHPHMAYELRYDERALDYDLREL